MGVGALQLQYWGREGPVGKVTLNSLTVRPSPLSTVPDRPTLGTQFLLDK